MRKCGIGIIAWAVFSLVSAMPAMAIDPIPNESGVSGFILMGTSYTDMKSTQIAGNKISDIGNETITSRNSGPSSDSSFGAMFNFELKYTLADSGTQFFVGNELEDLLRYDLATQAGVRQRLGGLGTGSASLVFNGISTEVWEDPFLENSPRVSTDRTANGARLVWDDIFGSDMQIQYTFRKIDIDTERSGASVGGLTQSDRDKLDREGSKHDIEVLYRFKGGSRQYGTHLFYPAVSYTLDDRDGGAVKEDGFALALTYAFDAPKYTFVLNGSVGTYESDEANPVYNKTQESDRYGVSGILMWKKPFGWECPFGKSWSLFLSTAYGKEDSNISFYDTEVFVSALGVALYF